MNWPNPIPARWVDVLVAYAELQREAAPAADELVALGVPDQRPAAMPGLLDDLLDDRAALLLDLEGGLDAATTERLRAHLPCFAEDCRRLADSDIPASVQHDDLHDGNVFVTADAVTLEPLRPLLGGLRRTRWRRADRHHPGRLRHADPLRDHDLPGHRHPVRHRAGLDRHLTVRRGPRLRRARPGRLSPGHPERSAQAVPLLAAAPQGAATTTCTVVLACSWTAAPLTQVYVDTPTVTG